MYSELITFIAILGLLFFWITIPMIPAIFIYRLFPDTHVTAEGPFANLTVKATGAFAGYLIVFASTFLIAEKGIQIIAGFQKPYWTISGTVILDNENKLGSQIIDRLEVFTKPAPFVIMNNKIKLQVPESNDIPFIHLVVPEFGSAIVDLNDNSTKIEKDKFRKEIRIGDEILIKQNSESWKNTIEHSTSNVLKYQY